MSSTFTPIDHRDPEKFYRALKTELEALMDRHWITNLSNACAMLKAHLRDVNWVGFYLFDQTELILGPFQGLPACLRIPMGKGVCGTAAKDRKSVLVADVDLFPGHITCDTNSRSELVIPLLLGSRLLGVLDVDAPIKNRFTTHDQTGLEAFAEALVKLIQWPERF